MVSLELTQFDGDLTLLMRTPSLEVMRRHLRSALITEGNLIAFRFYGRLLLFKVLSSDIDADEVGIIGGNSEISFNFPTRPLWHKNGPSLRKVDGFFCKFQQTISEAVSTVKQFGGRIHYFAIPGLTISEKRAFISHLSSTSAPWRLLKFDLSFLVEDGELENMATEMLKRQEMIRGLLAAGPKEEDRPAMTTHTVVLLDGLDLLPGTFMRKILKIVSFPQLANESDCHSFIYVIPICNSSALQELRESVSRVTEVELNEIKTDHDIMDSITADFLIDFQRLRLGYSLEESKARVMDEARGSEYMQIGALIPRGLSSWQSIKGYELVKERLKDLIYTLASDDELARYYNLRPVKGLLLYGPSGCGKSEIVKAIANDGRYPVIELRPADILSKYLGESEERLRTVFSKARSLKPCILHIDNMELLGARRQLDSQDTTGVSERLLSTLLNEMDGVIGLEGVIVIGCTTKKDAIDEALLRPGRLDHLIEIALPSALDREQLLKSELARLGYDFSASPVVDESTAPTVDMAACDFGRLIKTTAGFTCADIKNMLNKDARSRLMESFPLSLNIENFI